MSSTHRVPGRIYIEGVGTNPLGRRVEHYVTHRVTLGSVEATIHSKLCVPELGLDLWIGFEMPPQWLELDADPRIDPWGRPMRWPRLTEILISHCRLTEAHLLQAVTYGVYP